MKAIEETYNEMHREEPSEHSSVLLLGSDKRMNSLRVECMSLCMVLFLLNARKYAKRKAKD